MLHIRMRRKPLNRDVPRQRRCRVLSASFEARSAPPSHVAEVVGYLGYTDRASDVVVMAPLVESPGGVSPPGAPRTVREPLDSYGSRCSAVSMAQLPVSEEHWIDTAEPVKPVPRPFG